MIIFGQDGDSGIMLTTLYLESIPEKMWRMRDLLTMVMEVRDRSWRFECRALDVAKKNYIKSIPVGIFPIWPFFTILSNSARFSQSITTQASSSVLSGTVLNEIISKIVESPSSRYEICYTYTHKLCSSGNLQAAAMLMQSLHDKNISLGQSAYNCLIKAAGEQDDIELLCRIFKRLLVSCKSMDSSSYQILAKAFTMKSNDDDCLLRFVREVSELISLRNATVLNRIIYAFGERRQVNKAMLIFDNMRSSKCKPDLVTYNTILDILGQSGRIGEMLDLFASMEDKNLVPDIISFNTLINCLRKVGRLELCSKYFKEMLEKGIEPDLRTYTALIDVFSRAGNSEESFRLFNEMKHKGICPSIQIYQLLISNLKKMGKLDLAETVSLEMKELPSSLVDPKDSKRKKR